MWVSVSGLGVDIACLYGKTMLPAKTVVLLPAQAETASTWQG